MQVCAINQRISFNDKDKKLQKAIFKKQLKIFIQPFLIHQTLLHWA